MNLSFPGGGVGRVLQASAVAVTAPADTSENTLATITVPAGALGTTGALRIWVRMTYTNNANNKTLRARWSGAAGTVVWGPTRTTQLGSTTCITIVNRSVTNSQVYSSLNNNDASTADGNAGGTTAVDTTAATTVVLTAQKAVGGDTVTLEYYIAEIIQP